MCEHEGYFVGKNTLSSQDTFNAKFPYHPLRLPFHRAEAGGKCRLLASAKRCSGHVQRVPRPRKGRQAGATDARKGHNTGWGTTQPSASASHVCCMFLGDDDLTYFQSNVHVRPDYPTPSRSETSNAQFRVPSAHTADEPGLKPASSHVTVHSLGHRRCADHSCNSLHSVIPSTWHPYRLKVR